MLDWNADASLADLVLAELPSYGAAMSESHDTKSFRIDYRHLTFFFLGAVCVCAVFFALGFVVGRAQAFETALKEPEDPKNLSSGAATSPSATNDAAPTAIKEERPPVREADASQAAARADYRKDLDFYSAVKEQKVDQNFHPESPRSDKSASPSKNQKAETATGSSPSAARTIGSRAGLVSLQVAALKSSGEADRLAKTLRTKGYPVFIVNPPKEDVSKLIRVQIGPYTTEAEASKIKARLSTEGYTAITKH
jgi:cell division septation protein DedD